jgi:hypothetical protein
VSGEQGYPVGLSGRVPIKLSTENGPIKKGDRIMLSSIAGVGMKATTNARIVGIALEDFDGTKAYSPTYINQFGDDIARERIQVRAVATTTGVTNCYFGAGGALDEGGDECIGTPVTSAVYDTESNEEREAILAELANTPASAATVEGETVKIGQAVMFITLGTYHTATTTTMLADLMDTSIVENGNGVETLWDRLKMLAQNFVDGVLAITGLKADKVETNQLCVDGVCINGDQLRALLNGSGQTGGGSSSTPSPEPEPEPEVTEGPSPEPEVVEEPEPTSDQTSESISEGESTDGNTNVESTSEPEPVIEESLPEPEPEVIEEPAPEVEQTPEPEPSPEPASEPSV